jgi:hypothetical protein
MASITIEIVSKTHSEAGTTFVLAASEEEIKSAGFVPYFVDQYFHGVVLDPTEVNNLGCATPYGSVVLGPDVLYYNVGVLPFVPALTENHIDLSWVKKSAWAAWKLVKTTDKPNGTYQLNPLTPTMNVGDTLVYYDSKPSDPA